MVRNQVAKHFENMLGVPKEAGDGALCGGSVAVRSAGAAGTFRVYYCSSSKYL